MPLRASDCNPVGPQALPGLCCLGSSAVDGDFNHPARRPGRFSNTGECAGGLPPSIYPFPNLELLRPLVFDQRIDLPTVDALVDACDSTWPTIDDWAACVRDSVSINASNASAILDLDPIVHGGRMPRALAERIIAEFDYCDQRRCAVPRPMAGILPAKATGELAAIGAGLLPLTSKMFL